MPFALIIIGVALLAAGIRDTQGQLFDLVKGDFTGPNNFIFWVVSILVIGAIGYIPKLKGLSTAFLALVVIVLVLTKGNPKLQGGGFFAQISKQLGSTTQTATIVTGPATEQPLQKLTTPPVDLSLPTNLFSIQ